MTSPQLLAIVEVPREDRVRCHAPDCNHVVYRRIHVVREDSIISVYGSECFKKLFEGAPVSSSLPYYTSSEGRQLSKEERQMLLENTARLIERFETEYQAELASKTATSRLAPPETPATHTAKAPVAIVNSAMRQAAIAQAKQLIRSQYGVNPELPGWYGLVQSEANRILRENGG